MFTTADRKIHLERDTNGDVVLTVLATDGTTTLTQIIHGDEWSFLVRAI